jgi:hypothetical protein
MEIGHVELDVSRRTDRPDRLPFRHPVSFGDSDRTEVEESDCEVVRRSDRDRSAMGGKPPRERHSARRRRRHRRRGSAGDVDSGMAVLAIFVSAEIEAT